MESLADEILRSVQDCTGRPLREIAAEIAASLATVRIAAADLNRTGRAALMQKFNSRTIFLLPLRTPLWKHGLRICANCGRPFRLPVKCQRFCCCRACSIAWSWQRPNTKERRRASISAQKNTPEALAVTAKINKERWSRPGERERLSASNRRRWADPDIAADWARSIAKAQRTPEQRKLYSDLRKKYWKDPERKRRMLDGMNAALAKPAVRARASEAMRARWRDPVQREKMLAVNRRRSEVAAAKKRGTKERPEVTERRIAAGMSTRRMKKAKASCENRISGNGSLD